LVLFTEDILGQLVYVPRAVILTLAILLAYLFVGEDYQIHFQEKRLYLHTHPWMISFLFWGTLILTSTLIGRRLQNPYYHIFDNFGLFDEDGLNMEMIENVLFFIPYSFSFIKAFRPSRPWKAAFVLSACSSFFIEIFQLVFWLGSFQLSDLVHNIAGGMIGCSLWYLGKMISGNSEKR